MKDKARSGQRIDLSAESVTEVDRLIGEVAKHRPDDPMGVSAIAIRLGVLPLSLDAGGFIGLKRDGSIVGVDWEDASQEHPITLVRHRDVALIDAAQHYDFLKDFLPVRSPEARACPECSGTGVNPFAAAANVDNIVCLCGGLGWIPDNWEEI